VPWANMRGLPGLPVRRLVRRSFSEGGSLDVGGSADLSAEASAKEETFAKEGAFPFFKLFTITNELCNTGGVINRIQRNKHV
jgi:hypothetical protein